MDGQNDLAEESGVPINFEGPIDYPEGTEFTVGAFSAGTYQAAGTFDEAVVWRRALSADEVQNLYARGVLSLSLRARVCQQPDCSDGAEFTGPNGSGAYIDMPGTLSPPSQLPLEGLPAGRYFQYEASFEFRGTTVIDPQLLSVTIFAERG